jgi:hypothetical protein
VIRERKTVSWLEFITFNPGARLSARGSQRNGFVVATAL